MSMLQNAARLMEGGAQTIVSTASSSQSSAFSPGVVYIRVQVSAPIQVRIGTPPQTAVTTDTLLNVNYPEYFLVTQGQVLACIGAGNVSISQCTT
jgi:hypothetical protein